MVDPYAPPKESAGRPARPAPTVPVAEPYAGRQAYQQTEPPAYAPAPVHGTGRDHDRPWRRSEGHEPRTEPAQPGLFWTVAAVGIGLLCLARLMLFFVVSDDLPGDQVAAALFATLGVIALAGGLALAGLLQRGLATSWRIALMIGAGYFATVAGPGPILGFGGLL